jgi:hypothetical protein
MLDNSFTCSNGHSFNANAKLRARCPECGVVARRKFDEAAPKIEPKPEPKTEPVVAKTEPTVKRPVLLKQGRPRIMPKRAVAKKPPVVAKRSTTVIPRKSTAAAGLVKTSKIKVAGTMPTIKARPKKTAPARSVQGGQQPRKRRYWEDVADKYGF